MLLPNNLTAKSVDSLAGKNRAIFRDMGRAAEWNPMLYTGNPASSHILKKHIQALNVEQLNANVVKNVATPFMFDKLGRLCRYLSYKVSVENNLTAKFELSRDLSYFSFVCHSGNRGGHLSQKICLKYQIQMAFMFHNSLESQRQLIIQTTLSSCHRQMKTFAPLNY